MEDDQPKDLFDWGEPSATAEPVEGINVLIKPASELRDEVLDKALGDESEKRADRYTKWLKEVNAPIIDLKTLAERTDRVGDWKNYRENELINESSEEVTALVEKRKKEIEMKADSYAYLARGMRKALGEGKLNEVVAVMRTELGGADGLREEVVAGAEKLRQEKGIEAVVGLLPFYEQVTRNYKESPVMEKMTRVMEPAVGYEIWQREVEERVKPSGNLRRQGELNVSEMSGILTGSVGVVRFENIRGKWMPEVRELFEEAEGRKMGLGEVVAGILTSGKALKEVTEASMVGPTEGEREVTDEEKGKVTGILRLRLLGYMEASLVDVGKSLEMRSVRSLTRMMEAVAEQGKTAWQMINTDSGEMASEMRGILDKIKRRNPALLGFMKEELDISHRQKWTEISKKEDEANQVKEAEEARLQEEVKAEADRLADEKSLSGFFEKIMDRNNMEGRVGQIKQVRFGTEANDLRKSAEEAKQEESYEAKLAGEAMVRVAELIDGFDVNDLVIERQGLKKIKKPSEGVVIGNRRDIKTIEGDENWKKDRSKMADWTARMIFNRWLNEARFDKNNRPIVG